MQWAAIAILVCVTLQRLGELILDKRNTGALMATGGVEFGAKHYPLFLILHSAWLISLFVWTVWKEPDVHWLLFVGYLLIQGARVWVLSTLGRLWTTRIISIPDAPLITTGPYRFVHHPNYWIVIIEIALLPAVLGAWEIATLFSLLNAALLKHRIQVENSALSQRREI